VKNDANVMKYIDYKVRDAESMESMSIGFNLRMVRGYVRFSI
jgi:hypothetical protein